MTIEHMREVIQRKPFQPFVIHMADGRQITVSSPEFILTVPTSRTFIVAQPDGRFHILDLLLVTGVELGSAPPSGGKDGQTTPVV